MYCRQSYIVECISTICRFIWNLYETYRLAKWYIGTAQSATQFEYSVACPQAKSNYWIIEQSHRQLSVRVGVLWSRLELPLGSFQWCCNWLQLSGPPVTTLETASTMTHVFLNHSNRKQRKVEDKRKRQVHFQNNPLCIHNLHLSSLSPPMPPSLHPSVPLLLIPSPYAFIPPSINPPTIRHTPKSHPMMSDGPIFYTWIAKGSVTKVHY